MHGEGIGCMLNILRTYIGFKVPVEPQLQDEELYKKQK